MVDSLGLFPQTYYIYSTILLFSLCSAQLVTEKLIDNRFSEDFTSMIVNGIKEATQLIPFFCKFYCLLKSRKHGHSRHRIIPIPVSVLEVLIVIVFRVTNPDFLPPLGLLCAKLTQPFPHRNCK